MLDGLRHDAIVCRHHEERHIDARCTRDHLAHELLVPRHVHDAHVATVGQPQLGKAERDGDAPLLFFRQAVRVGSRQRFNQG